MAVRLRPLVNTIGLVGRTTRLQTVTRPVPTLARPDEGEIPVLVFPRTPVVLVRLSPTWFQVVVFPQVVEIGIGGPTPALRPWTPLQITIHTTEMTSSLGQGPNKVLTFLEAVTPILEDETAKVKVRKTFGIAVRETVLPSTLETKSSDTRPYAGLRPRRVVWPVGPGAGNTGHSPVTLRPAAIAFDGLDQRLPSTLANIAHL